MNNSNDLRAELQEARERAAALQESLARRERQIEAMHRVSEALFQQLDRDDIVRRTLDVALEVLAARSGSLQLYEAARDELVFHYVVGPAAQTLTNHRVPATQGISGQVLRTGVPDVTSHVEQHGDLNPLARRSASRREYSRADAPGEKAPGEEASEAAQTMITVPLKRPSGAAIGVMQLVREDAAGFDHGDLETLEVLCASAATAIETARLAQQARQAEVAGIVGDISHDIKNMLTPIQSGLWTLEPLLDQLFSELDAVQEQLHGRSAARDIARIAALVRVWNRGEVALGEGRHETARADLCEAGTLLAALNNAERGRGLLRSLACLFAESGEMKLAARMIGARDALASDEIEEESDESPRREETLARDALGEEAFEAARQEGRALTLQNAVREACEA